MWKGTLATAVATLASLAWFGCGSVDGDDPADAAADADPTVPDADPTAPDADPTVPDAGPSVPDADPTAPDAAGGPSCGGFSGMTCEPGFYCDWTPNSCGIADQIGECLVMPMFCPDIYDPVCACNGLTYSNECDANAAGWDIIYEGKCM